MTTTTTDITFIIKVITSLQGLKFADFPTTYDEEHDDAWFLCPFCKETGYFPTGNGGIEHLVTCPIALAFTRPALLEGCLDNPFDETAWQVILYALKQPFTWPERKEGERWFPFCPFCPDTYTMARRVPLPHEPECILALAQNMTYIRRRRGEIV